MGKRVERSSKDKSGQSSSQDTNEDDANKTPEPYTCTGAFEADFIELCRRSGIPQSEIPPVVVRAKRPGTPPPPDPKKDDPKGKNQPPPEPTPDIKDDSDPVPKTYVTKEKYQYFKPTIQVEMENEDKPNTVTEIFVRGWKIDELMMGIFKQCFPTIEKLHSINFWNTSLTENTVKELASFLPQCSNLRNVTIEGNTCTDEPWALLIGEDSLIVHLSLRHNGITDKGASSIGKALSTEKTCNKNLLTLSLCHNKITDIGAAALVSGLRMNRVLLSLSLANNRIGDEGAVKFGEVLSRFPLFHFEVVERRKLISDKGSPERGSGKSPPPSRRAESKDRPGSVRSGSHLDKGDKRRNKSSNKKDNKKDKEDTAKGTKKEDKWKKVGSKASLVSMADAAKATKGKKTASSKDKKAHEVETPDILEAVNPLSEPVESLEGQLWIPGNRSLINLNLARNKIKEPGIKSLLLAVQYQTALCSLSPHPSLKGLLKLSLQGNPIEKDNEHFTKLQEMMVMKDPFYKPVSLSPSGENQSTAG